MTTQSIQTEKELKDIHFKMLEWKSILGFIEGEMTFINQLLHSYVFEPTTPNLFEKLQEFRIQMIEVNKDLQQLKESIQEQENKLGGMLECDTVSCDTVYFEKYKEIKASMKSFNKHFAAFKADVFQYAGNILKKNKK
ncbi:hypothetical protein [Aquimarina brevivitae]|uniref:Uncharacterized protein n=1 Tax=Aquimarina brevivitae TaxID=323412 RepID=A0A4Q7PL65_9FLAO|nr:hypothetical protein [Aquimarina brevivitae]RZS99702.1 hypothetical protein EV197_0925 [Aquimarina brevivitae]